MRATKDEKLLRNIFFSRLLCGRGDHPTNTSQHLSEPTWGEKKCGLDRKK
jgi:hypothetical protein